MEQEKRCECGAAVEGHRKRCDVCRRRIHQAAQRRWRQANAEQVARKDRAYKATHADRINAQRRARRTPAAAEAEARAKRMARYGLTPEEWDALLASQGGGCAICGTHTPGGRGWHTDHDHATNQTRGILCSGCNPALGYMDDDPARLRAAADYLERHR